MWVIMIYNISRERIRPTLLMIYMGLVRISRIRIWIVLSV